MFVLNNVSKRNLDEKFKDLESALEEKHHQWFAHYLVEELAKTQLNFQGLYLQLLENFDKKILWQEVLRETYVSCARMLNAQATMDQMNERNNLKNLAKATYYVTDDEVSKNHNEVRPKYYDSERPPAAWHPRRIRASPTRTRRRTRRRSAAWSSRRTPTGWPGGGGSRTVRA